MRNGFKPLIDRAPIHKADYSSMGKSIVIQYITESQVHLF